MRGEKSPFPVLRGFSTPSLTQRQNEENEMLQFVQFHFEAVCKQPEIEIQCHVRKLEIGIGIQFQTFQSRGNGNEMLGNGKLGIHRNLGGSQWDEGILMH